MSCTNILDSFMTEVESYTFGLCEQIVCTSAHFLAFGFDLRESRSDDVKLNQ